jgi:rhodanese-related sulfurtransferase
MRIYILLALVSALLSCNNKAANNAPAQASPQISSQDAIELVQNQGYQFIDIRTPEEIANGKIPSALEIDYQSDDFKEKVSQLDKSNKYVLYCRSGGRSGRAWTLMNDMGFKDLKDATDGYESLNKELNK